MIIPDEKSYAQCLLENGLFHASRAKKDLYIIAKYLYHSQHYATEDIITFTTLFAMDKSILTKMEISQCMVFIQKHISSSKLKSPDAILFTNDEISQIKALETINMQKLMFCLWTLAKIQCQQAKNNKQKQQKVHKNTTLGTEEQLFLFDNSKHQRDIFSLAGLSHLRIAKRMELLRMLSLKKYIFIKTISNHAKMILVEKSSVQSISKDNDKISFFIVPTLYPEKENAFSYHQFIHIWDEHILQNPKPHCKICKNPILKKNNRQLYCHCCKEFMEKIWDKQNKKKRALENTANPH